VSEYAASRAVLPDVKNGVSARASTRTSATARFIPFAPVGGTICAASPARKRRPNCIGSTTKLRMPVRLFSITGPSCSFHTIVGFESLMQFRPHAVVGPALEVFLGRHLDVQPRDLGRTHAVERKAALMGRINELVVRRRRFGEQAEPRKGIRALE